MKSVSSRSEILLHRYQRILEDRKANSSEPLSAFCRSHKINQWTYYYWKKKLSQTSVAAPAEKTKAFIPVRIPSRAQLDNSYEIHFDTATRLVLRPGFNKDEVGALITILLANGSRCLA
jgi:hypothetical protein